jgi:hypothetical protein
MAFVGGPTVDVNLGGASIQNPVISNIGFNPGDGKSMFELKKENVLNESSENGNIKSVIQHNSLQHLKYNPNFKEEGPICFWQHLGQCGDSSHVINGFCENHIADMFNGIFVTTKDNITENFQSKIVVKTEMRTLVPNDIKATYETNMVTIVAPILELLNRETVYEILNNFDTINEDENFRLFHNTNKINPMGPRNYLKSLLNESCGENIYHNRWANYVSTFIKDHMKDSRQWQIHLNDDILDLKTCSLFTQCLSLCLSPNITNVEESANTFPATCSQYYKNHLALLPSLMLTGTDLKHNTRGSVIRGPVVLQTTPKVHNFNKNYKGRVC